MRRQKNVQRLVVIVVVVALASVGAVVWWFYANTKQSVEVAQINDASNQEQTSEEQVPIVEEAPADKFDAEALQRVVDTWVGGLSGDASVVITDAQGKVLAQHNQDESYFTASLYKLYVAYEGYRAVDSGLLNGTDKFQSTRTVGECLDLMIRESDSPCGERMWADIGKETIDDALKNYGVTMTDMVGLQTTAEDTAIMLARIARGEGLSEASTNAYLDSLQDQPVRYRRGLPSGFSDKVTVYNKVGWNEQLEWHDAAIIEREDGERLVIAVLTSGVGSVRIAELGTMIEETVATSSL